ncbi:unnamed protein product, partial [Oikopleura dioica]
PRPTVDSLVPVPATSKDVFLFVRKRKSGDLGQVALALFLCLSLSRSGPEGGRGQRTTRRKSLEEQTPRTILSVVLALWEVRPGECPKFEAINDQT